MIKWLILLGLIAAVAGAAFTIMLVTYKAYMRRKTMKNNEYDNYPQD